MGLASELVLGVVSLIIAVGLTVLGRKNSERLARNGLVFVTYPALVLLFLSIGGVTLINMMLR